MRFRTPSATDCHTIGPTNADYTTVRDNCKLRSEFAIEERRSIERAVKSVRDEWHLVKRGGTEITDGKPLRS